MAVKLKYNIIKSNWLNDKDVRLDASFHLKGGRLVKKIMEEGPCQVSFLKDVTEGIFNGARFKRYYVTDPSKGIPFMGSSDMLKLELSDLNYISKKLSKNINLLEIKKDWILISCSGTIGNIVYTNENFANKTGSQHIMRVVPGNKLKSGYLYAYLSSKYGHTLLTQGTYGAVIQHIEPSHIEELPVPVFKEKLQDLIHEKIIEAAKLKYNSSCYLEKAINYFESKIGITNVSKGFQYSKINSGSLLHFHKRLDAQYQLLTKGLSNEQIKGIDYSKISMYANAIFVGGRGKRMYVENGLPFLSSSDMMLFNPKKNCKKISKNTPGLSLMKVSKKDILISRSGTVGNTILVGEDLNNIAISEHALRLVINPDKISPNYVYCFLKTKYGMKCMEALSFGSVIITLNENLIGNIDLPILPAKDQKKIENLIEEYLINMDLSTAKENEAMDLIEKEIESWQK